MLPVELFRARIVWLNILDLEFAELLNWRGWAEKIILEIDFIAPFWLCELTVAPDSKSALKCIRENVGIERTDFPDLGIDEMSLTFGLIYFRYSRDDEWAQEAWRTMDEYGDTNEYVEGRHWEQYQKNQILNLSETSFEERVKLIFRPVAAAALRTLRCVLNSPRHTIAFMRVVH